MSMSRVESVVGYISEIQVEFDKRVILGDHRQMNCQFQQNRWSVHCSRRSRYATTAIFVRYIIAVNVERNCSLAFYVKI